jgi:hypothetical protein
MLSAVEPRSGGPRFLSQQIQDRTTVTAPQWLVDVERLGRLRGSRLI